MNDLSSSLRELSLNGLPNVPKLDLPAFSTVHNFHLPSLVEVLPRLDRNRPRIRRMDGAGARARRPPPPPRLRGRRRRATRDPVRASSSPGEPEGGSPPHLRRLPGGIAAPLRPSRPSPVRGPRSTVTLSISPSPTNDFNPTPTLRLEGHALPLVGPFPVLESLSLTEIETRTEDEID